MKQNTSGNGQAIWVVLVFLIASACSQEGDGTDEGGSMETPDETTVSKEVESPADTAAMDSESLVEGSYESPMTELESVDEVELSEEEQRQAEEAAADAEHRVKPPSKPEEDD